MDDNEERETNEIPLYSNIDADTLSLLEVALNCMISLSEAQIEEPARENLLTIADEIALRFGINKMEVEELLHGDEVIYKPRGGIFNDEEEGELPSKE